MGTWWDGLGTGGSYTADDVKIVHFGSPEGQTYGSKADQTVEEFMHRNPEFIIERKD